MLVDFFGMHINDEGEEMKFYGYKFWRVTGVWIRNVLPYELTKSSDSHVVPLRVLCSTHKLQLPTHSFNDFSFRNCFVE